MTRDQIYKDSILIFVSPGIMSGADCLLNNSTDCNRPMKFSSLSPCLMHIAISVFQKHNWQKLRIISGADHLSDELPVHDN